MIFTSLSAFLVEFIFISTIPIGILYLYYNWVYYYSKNSHVPWVLKPTFPIGNLTLINAKNVGLQFAEWYSSAKRSGYKIAKGYNAFEPYYLLIDLQYIKRITHIDFEYFNDRGLYINKKNPITVNLLSSSGDTWKSMRSKLSPSFSSGNIRNVFPTLLQCGRQLEEAVENKRLIHLNELATCYSINVIGSYAFGIDCNTFTDPNMEFKKQGEKLFYINWYTAAKVYFQFKFPKVALKLGITLFPEKSVNFFTKVVKEVLEYRLKNNVTRKDMLQVLMEINKKDGQTEMHQATYEDFNYNEITAQALLFFPAGFQTSSITIMHSLYEMALNQDIQNKVRDEISHVLEENNGNITYDALIEMKYMSQVIDETLRKYPPLMYLFRTAVSDYTIPGTNIELTKGTRMLYSILGIHRDPEYYPEPELFDPERFSVENKKRIPACAYMPYGNGPRICVASQLAATQIKIALTSLLKSYRVSLNEKTKLPMRYQVFSLTFNPSTQIYLNIEKV